MKKYMILFSVGKDRPGIVDDVSTVLFLHNANMEDSRMAVMGGRFSIMTLFSCETDQLEPIKNGLQGLKELGLDISLHEAEEPTAVPKEPALPFLISPNPLAVLCPAVFAVPDSGNPTITWT